MKPLYFQARNNELGDTQYMDQETIEWIEAQPTGTSALCNVSITQKEIKLIRSLSPQRSHFLNKHNYNSIHGIQHILRVMINVILVCKLIGTDYMDHVLAASVHDLRRINDRRDIGHGKRAAIWFKQNLPTLQLHSHFIHDLDRVYDSVYYHDLDYNDIPLKILDNHKLSIDILKAADALDRYRQPNIDWWPKINFFQIKEAETLFNICKHSVVISERYAVSGIEPTESVLKAAQEIFINKA